MISRSRRAALEARLRPLTVTSEHERVEPALTQSTDLSRLRRLVLSTVVLDVTREHILAHGAANSEAALCWAGTTDGESGLVTTALVFASAGERGSVHVSASETGLLYAHCHARGLTLLAQVHSHPADAFHSPFDERSPHSAEPGFLSLVVPNFGACRFDSFEAWAVFEQVSYEKWREWDATEKRRRLKLLDSVISIP